MRITARRALPLLALLILGACSSAIPPVTADDPLPSHTPLPSRPPAQAAPLKTAGATPAPGATPTPPALAEAPTPPVAPRITEAELAQLLGGVQGCFVLRDVTQQRTLRSDGQACQKRIAPCSTFKIPHALIALDAGVVADEQHVLAWDGRERWNPEWNRDHTLSSALRFSVVWYFQRVAAEIGEERMRRALTDLNYGNADISGGLTQFWLQSSLAISPEQQVDFLERLYAGQLPFSARAQSIVQQMLVLEERGGVILSGKTGSCATDAPWTWGWFVGAVTSDRGTSVFATLIEAPDGAQGVRARALAETILQRLELLPPGE